MKYILVTGGLGFIGSHVVVKLLNLYYNVIIIDNLSNSHVNILDKIKELKETNTELIFYEGDIRNDDDLKKIFENHEIDHVINFAALKSVSESQKYPDLYQDVNVNGSINLLTYMKKYNVTKFIYSSSATVYGDSKSPVDENSKTGNNLACNYAKNKYDMEEYLKKNKETKLKDFDITILRYFNPIGAHESGLIGEDPNGIPNNIFPYLLRVAKYTNEINDFDKSHPYSKLTIFGDDYDTRDGTCIRDYIHVQDLADAHIKCIKYMNKQKLNIYNVGTGNNVTVLELVIALNETLEKNGKNKINFVIGNRRDGDLDISYSNVDLINKEINFKSKYDIYDMCEHGLRFVKLI